MDEAPEFDFNAEQLVEQAREFFRKGRLGEAEACLRKAIDLEPDRSAWRLNLGVTLQAAGRGEEALQCFEIACKCAPKHAEPRLAAAIAAAALGRWPVALKWAEQATQFDPSLDAGWGCRVESLRRLGRREDAMLVFYLAQQHLEAMPATLQAVADVLVEDAKIERAMWCLREAIRLEPNLPRARTRLAQLLGDGGHAHRAVELLTEELRLRPGDVSTLLAFGDVLLRQRRDPEAAEKFRRAIEIDPANAAARWRLGVLAANTRRFDEACTELEMAMRLDPSNPLPRVELARARLENGEMAEAARLLEIHVQQCAPETNPRLENVEAAVNLASLMLAAQKPALAARVLTAAMRFERVKNAAMPWQKLALAHYRNSDLDKGNEASERLLAIEPENLFAMHNLGLAWLSRGDNAKAMSWIRKGLAIKPNDASFRRLRWRARIFRYPWLARLIRSDAREAGTIKPM
ncbi:MAG: tetratricopeptide repeat protein [Planctomycetes bacterium]|nr:tetratricopeptide repeat protein [Planctomycetota bacterium]